MRDYLKNKLGVPENWDKYDYQTQRYSFEDIEEILQTYKDEKLAVPRVMWRFCAYKTEKDYDSGDHYFMKDFLDHTEMKVFSSEHSAKEKLIHPDYCSMYWKIETNAT